MMHPDDYADQRRDPGELMRHNFQINDWIVRCTPRLGRKQVPVDVAFWLLMASSAVCVIAQWWV